MLCFYSWVDDKYEQTGVVASPKFVIQNYSIPDSKVRGANIGPIWGLQNFAIWDGYDHNSSAI